MKAWTCTIALTVGLLVPAMGVAQPTEPPAQEAQAKPVEEGVVPKSIRIPGTDLSLSIGGYVKLDVIHDCNAIGEADEFKVSTIPARGTEAAAHSGRTTLHARETRVSLELKSHAPEGPFRAFVEGDFFGSGNAFRMRHAFGEFGHLLGGQTWTTFMDISARPLTLDFEEPEGEVFVRQAMVRWTSRPTGPWPLRRRTRCRSSRFLRA